MATTKVTSAGIADNATTLAKMAGGTDGNLITYDASGDPAYVTTGTSGQVLTSGGVGVAPTFQTSTHTPDDNSVTLAKMAHGTDGELITYDATGAPANVAVGTSGQVLTSGGVGVAPTFQTAAGGGKVLQVVQTVLGEGNNLTSFNPSSYATAQAITNATISYTPLSTTSKLLVMNDTYFYTNNSGNQSWFYIRLSLMYNYSTSAPTSPTALFQRPDVFSHDWSSSTNGVWSRNSSSMSYLHDHNTPSGESITYKMYWDTSSGAATATFDKMRLNRSSNMGTFTIIEVET